MRASSIKPYPRSASIEVVMEPEDGTAVFEYIAAMSEQLSMMARNCGDLGLALTLEAASAQAERMTGV